MANGSKASGLKTRATLTPFVWAEERALEQMVNGAVQVLASRFRALSRSAPHQELPAMAGRHFFKRFARFRVLCERFSQIGGNRNSARAEINPKFDAHRVACIRAGRLPLRGVDLHAVVSAACGHERGPRTLAAHDGDDGNVFRVRALFPLGFAASAPQLFRRSRAISSGTFTCRIIQIL